MTRVTVDEYGATGDGASFDHEAINEAIRACNAAGGGVVVVPDGEYLCGSIRLRSDVTLQLAAGATIQAAPGDAGVYDEPVENPWEEYQGFGHSHWRNALVWGESVENVGVRGPGRIDGDALARSDAEGGGAGDKCIAFKESTGVEVADVTIDQGGHFAVKATGCDDVRIDGVTIRTSRDGVNLVACRDAVVTDSEIEAVRYEPRGDREHGVKAGGDDAIALKSDYSLGDARTSENVRIENCDLSSGCSAVQFGSETVGDFRNVTVRNVRVEHADKAAVSITSNDGAIVEDVTVEDVTVEKAANVLYMHVQDRGRRPGESGPGRIRDVTVEGLTARDCYGYIQDRVFTSTIKGTDDHPIEDVTLRDVDITYRGGHDGDVDFAAPDEAYIGYQPRKLGTRPASGFYCRHVRGLTFEDVDVDFEAPDHRPAFVLEHAHGVSIDGARVERPAAADDVRLRDADDVSLDGCRWERDA